jgi:hypothetical protein
MNKLKTLFSLLMTLTFTLIVSAAGGATLSLATTGTLEFMPETTTGLYLLLSVTDFVPKHNMAFSDPFVFSAGICKNLQTGLVDLMGGNAPELKRTPVGYLQALTSTTNRAGLETVQIDQKTGKKKKVDITYSPRGLESDVDDEYNDGCTEEISDVPYEDTVEITDVLSLKGLTFSEDEMRKLCEPDQNWVTRRIAARIDGFMVALNKRLIALQNTNFGNFANGSPAVQSRQLLTVESGANRSANPYGEALIFNDFEDVDQMGRPMLIGQGKLRNYTRLVDIGCCNDQGINVGEAGDFDYFRDKHVGGVLGNADDFIGLVPGHVQLLTYNKYKGAYVKRNDSFAKYTIIDPVTGLELDMRVKYNDCTERWIFTFSLWYNLWFLPTDAYKSADPLYGTNGTLHFRATEA